MTDPQPNNPLHGVTLKSILEELLERYAWDGLAERVPVACFRNEPSLKSSLKFLRKTPWARTKVEQLYLDDLRIREHRRQQNKRRAAMRAHRAAEENNVENGEGEDPGTGGPLGGVRTLQRRAGASDDLE